jgi:hypothetical protein
MDFFDAFSCHNCDRQESFVSLRKKRDKGLEGQRLMKGAGKDEGDYFQS